MNITLLRHAPSNFPHYFLGLGSGLLPLALGLPAPLVWLLSNYSLLLTNGTASVQQLNDLLSSMSGFMGGSDSQFAVALILYGIEMIAVIVTLRNKSLRSLGHGLGTLLLLSAALIGLLLLSALLFVILVFLGFILHPSYQWT